MNERDQLLRAIVSNPDEDTPRLVFADWLDEHGEGKADRMWAAFIRAQIARERSALPHCDRFGGSHQDSDGICAPAKRCRCAFCQLARREWDASWWCRTHHKYEALEPVIRRRPRHLRNLSAVDYAFFPKVWFRRGFPELLRIEAHELVALAGALFARSPLTEIELAGNLPGEGAWDSAAVDRPYRWRDAGRANGDFRFTFDGLPRELFELLPGGMFLSREQDWKLYTSHEEARQAVSRACLKYGRAARDRLWVEEATSLAIEVNYTLRGQE